MAYIEGTYRNETIYGTRGNDTIDGKGGSDYLKDSYTSNDTYIFNYKYGQMPILDKGGNDILLFGDGITADKLKFYKSNTGNLIIRVKDTRDKPEIMGWFLDSKHSVETLKFRNGTTLSSSQIANLINYSTKVIIATASSDSIKVSSGNNLVYLMQGNDVFTCTGGNNIVEASSGNDKIYNKGIGNDEIYMEGGTDYTEDYGGNDRYIFTKGDGRDSILDTSGSDTVKFGIGTAKENLVFNKNSSNLVVTFTNSSDSLTIKNWLKGAQYRIETFELWNGSTVTAQEINKKLGLENNSNAVNIPTPTITGTDAYNYITSSSSSDDIYYLKKSNDRVMDYLGNDTYLFYKGDGQDNITDRQGADRIIFGEGITKSGVSFKKDPNNSENLIISINNSTDSVNINKWFRSPEYQIEQIKFLDGSYFDNVEVNGIIQQMAAYNPPVEASLASIGTTEQSLQNTTLVQI